MDGVVGENTFGMAFQCLGWLIMFRYPVSQRFFFMCDSPIRRDGSATIFNVCFQGLVALHVLHMFDEAFN